MKTTLQAAFCTDLARRCRRAERRVFAVLAVAVLAFAGTGAQAVNAAAHAHPGMHQSTQVVERATFGWPL